MIIKTRQPGVLLDIDKGEYIIFSMNIKTIDKVKSAFTYSAIKSYGDGYLINVPACDDTIAALDLLGLPTRGMEPLRYYYTPPPVEGKFTPMDHQVDTSAFMAAHKRGFVFNSMRTGKTYSTVAALDYLMRLGKVHATLIVTTVSTMTGVWERTIKTTLPDAEVVVVHGGVGKVDRMKKLDRIADFYIINYDGVKMVRDELVQMKERGVFNAIVIDELTHYGNPQSKRFKAMNEVVNGKRPAEYVWGLTGSPGSDPIPVFGMVKIVKPSNIQCSRLDSWRGYTQYRYGSEAWMWRNKDGTAELINNTMQPAIRFDKKDIFDLPPVVYQRRDCSLSKEQVKAYEEMKQFMIAEVKEGEVIEAVHKASLMQKLFQIALGVAIVEDGTAELDDKDRLATLCEIIDEAQAKTVIFCPYVGVISRLEKQLSKKYSVGVVTGAITGNKRTRIFDDFQNKKDPQVLIAHPQTTAFGVELAAADTMIFNGPPLSGGFIYEQALERLSSLKQMAGQISIVQLSATREEREFFYGLDNGVKSSQLINDMFAKITVCA